MISSLLDSAMANCLFSQGKAGLTAELNIRFIAPVITGRAALVKAWMTDSHPPLYILEGNIIQNCKIAVRATGKFMKRQ
jgi:acyl-coenzyme A thioesterase PaaI-like protein